MKLFFTVFVILVFSFISHSLTACSDFCLPKCEGEPVVSVRTMDFNASSFSRFICAPKGLKWQGLVQDKPTHIPIRTGLKWENRYSFIAIDIAGEVFSIFTGKDAFIDGMNEKGLSACTLWLDEGTNPKPTKEQKEKVISQLDVVAWILGNFDNVADVVKAFDKDDPDVYVCQVAVPIPGDPMPIPAHVVVHDANNNSVVLEWVSEDTFRPKVYTGDSYLNSITNCTYAWEIDYLTTNIMYVNLTNKDTYVPTTGCYHVGAGAISLPGDGDSDSRWLQGYFLMPNVTPRAPYDCNVPWRVIQALRSMGHNDKFYGEQYRPSDSPSKYTFTEWTLARDHTNMKFYYSCMKNQQVKTLNFADYEDYMNNGRKTKNIGDLSTWYDSESNTKTNLVSSRFNSHEMKGGTAVRVTLQIGNDRLGQYGKMFIYAIMADGMKAAWNGRNWIFLKPDISEMPSCFVGDLRTQTFTVPFDSSANWHGVQIYAGYGKNSTDMFLKENCSLVYFDKNTKTVD